MNTREAKDFLIGKIEREAQLAGVSLSDEDRRLLYYTEEEAASAAGIREDRLASDDSQFERTASKLLRSAYERHKGGPDEKLFNQAVRKIHDGDHYLALIANGAIQTHRTRDFVLYVLIAIAVVGIAFAIAIFTES
jgi:hypothetical protein